MVTNLLGKGKAMLQDLKRLIFGVGPSELAAVDDVTVQQRADSEPPKYLPASKLELRRILGIDGGTEYSPWRMMEGEQWYVRADLYSPEIHGGDDFDDEDYDDIEAEAETNFDDDAEQSLDDYTARTLATFNRNIAILKSRYARGEIVDSDNDSEFTSEDYDNA